jgi:hypothetical protein
VYARLRHGRLVLIGSPGAGKTSAMILLLMQALHYRELVSRGKRARVPVPVWLTMGSWNPGRKAKPGKTEMGLRSWVTKTIIRDHPYLLAEEFGPDAVAQLYDRGRIALFLDGLDEMPETLRAQALSRIEEEAPGLRVVITSRPGELRRTLDTGVHFPYTPVVKLRPVTPQAAASYLLTHRTKTGQSAWKDVASHLLAHPDGVLARTLNTPLTLSLARSAYEDGDPGGLLAFESTDERILREHLIDQVLVAAYPEPNERDLATFWLGWLAYMMNIRLSGPIRDLRWWKIPHWLPRRIPVLGGALVVGLVIGLSVTLAGALVAWVMIGLLTGVIGPSVGVPVSDYVTRVKVGFVFAVVIGILAGALIGIDLAGQGGFPRSMEFRWPTRRELRNGLGRGLRRGVGHAFVVIWLGWAAAALWLQMGLWTGLRGFVLPLLAGLALGFVSWVIGMLLTLLSDVWGVPIAAAEDVTPNSIYRKDVQTQLMSGLLMGISRTFTFCLISGVVGWLIAVPFVWQGVPFEGIRFLMSYALFWVTGGLWVGPSAAFIVFSLGLAAWLGVTLLIGVVSGLVGALGKGSAPLLFFSEIGLGLGREGVRFMPLLERALDRQILRQAGAFYQFRHADLQDRLANQYSARRSQGPYKKYTYAGDPW